MLIDFFLHLKARKLPVSRPPQSMMMSSYFRNGES